LRRELAAARAADHLHRLVASDLPPTKAQREELGHDPDRGGAVMRPMCEAAQPDHHSS